MHQKAWTATDRLSAISKSHLSLKKKKWEFFQADVKSVLLYGCTFCALTKPLREKARWQLHKDAACFGLVWFGWVGLRFMAYQPL